MKLAFSTNAFKKNTLPQAIESIHQIGYTGVELMADLHHAYPATVNREELHGELSRRNLPVSNINAFTLFACGDTYHPTWIEGDAQLRQRRIRHTIDCIHLAAEVGAKTVSLQPGGPLIGTGLTRQRAGELYAEGLAAVLPVAKERNIILAVEPEPGLFIQSADEYLEFKRSYFRDEPLIRMNCDIGHLFCVGDAPAAVIRKHPEQIAHVHLEDIGANRVHQHLTPGKGAIKFAEIFAALRDIHYDGWTTVELYPYETTAAGVAQAAWNHLQQFT